MRISLVLALAAATALAACNEAPKSGASSARAPVGPAAPAASPATAPATTAQAANCPTVQPACPVAPKAKTPAKAQATARTRTHVRHARADKRVPHRAATIERRHAEVDVHRGLLPPRPYRYDELRPQIRERHHDRHAYREDDGTRFHHPRRHRHEGHAERHDRYERRDRYVEPAPRAYEEERRRAERDEGRYEDRYAERYEERREDRYAPPPRHYEQRRAYAYDGGEMRETRRRSEYESYSERYSSSESHAQRGPCCAPVQAAGFDERGYLTWPGKTPR